MARSKGRGNKAKGVFNTRKRRGFLTREDIRAVEDQASGLHGMINHYAQISRQIEKRRKSIDEEIKHIVTKYKELEQRNKRSWKTMNAMNPDAKIKHAPSDQLRRKKEQVAELEKENEDLERKDNDISDKLSTICTEHGRLHDVVRVARQLLEKSDESEELEEVQQLVIKPRRSMMRMLGVANGRDTYASRATVGWADGKLRLTAIGTHG